MKVRIVNSNKVARVGMALLFALCAAAAPAQNPNPGILPIISSPQGKSYGNWAEAWWQWAFSIPAAQNPVLDTTGQFAGVGQSGPVWFMPSVLFGSAERTFTIPTGKTLFLPVYQWIFGATAGDCAPSNPGVTCDVPSLRESAAAATTSAQTVEAWIDGVPVEDIRSYRAISPDSFSVTLPDGSVPEVLGLPVTAGTFSPQVADGYWLMLTPLSAGAHTIRVHVIPAAAFGNEFTVIYHLTVK